MDMVTIVAILMVGTVIASVFLKKVPMQFTLCIVPVVCGLILGYPIKDVGDIAMGQITKSLQSAGIMCLFAMIYFTMLSETGMFNTITRQLIKLTRGKVNVYMVMILTSLIAGIGMMTATVVTSYTIVFPAMMPLYKKMKFDRAAAMIIAQTAIAGMCFLPWGIAVVNSSVFANVDAMELSRRLIPVAICFIPAIVLQWVYFGIQHKRRGLPMVVEWSDEEGSDEEENPLRRPKLFWINLLIFLAAIAALVTAAVPSYLVFIIASFLTIMIDYREPKDYQKMLNKAAGRFGGTLITLIRISVFLGSFNETGMVNALVAAGIVDLETAFSGFGNKIVVLIAPIPGIVVLTVYSIFAWKLMPKEEGSAEKRKADRAADMGTGSLRVCDICGGDGDHAAEQMDGRYAVSGSGIWRTGTDLRESAETV